MLRFLITGPPGVGKTTAIRKVASSLGEDADGFYTEEIREKGSRRGFKIVTLRGESGLLAHMSLGHGPRLGRYRVNLEDLESIGVRSLLRAIDSGRVLIVDEIGGMEMLSKEFREAVQRALDSGIDIVATIRERADPFCDSIKSRSDVTLIRMDGENRDQVPDLILKAFHERQE